MRWLLALLFISYNTLYSQYIDSLDLECSDQNDYIFYIIPDFSTQYFWSLDGEGTIINDWNHGIEVDFYSEAGTRLISVYGKDQGCTTDTSYYKITLLECKLVYIPNAFTPNEDGINDKFYIRGNVELVIFSIFNRWGENIFTTRDINEGWDGEYKYVPCPMGIYVYYVIILKEGKQHLYKGNITLIR